jgi:copper chaperone CopZ
MTCDHCVNAVKVELSSLAALRAGIEVAGYEALS